VLKDDKNGIQCLLGSVNNLIGRKQEAVAPRVSEFPNEGVRSAESTSNPVDASSAGRVYKKKKKKRRGVFEMNISLN
jgi:hypothetical protein